MEFKYLLIFALYIPLSSYGILNALADYKLRKTSYFIAGLRLAFWLAVLLVSVFANYIVEYAINNELTQADFLTNYDVVTMFVVLILVSLTMHFYGELKLANRRFNKLHEHVSIQFITPAKNKQK